MNPEYDTLEMEEGEHGCRGKDWVNEGKEQ